MMRVLSIFFRNMRDAATQKKAGRAFRAHARRTEVQLTARSPALMLGCRVWKSARASHAGSPRGPQ